MNNKNGKNRNSKYILSGFIILALFFGLSFVKNPEAKPRYELELNVIGCSYQISVNDKLLIDGKSYQSLTKKLDISNELTDSGEQNIDVKMIRISREMPLRATDAHLELELRKITTDTTIVIKNLKLPTFPYNDDQEEQPYSIGGSILFDIHPITQKENPTRDSLKTKPPIQE